MSNKVITLIPPLEVGLIDAYLSGSSDSPFEDYFEAHEITDDETASALEIAVARVLLAPVQHRLPQCVVIEPEGETRRTRKPIKRHPEATIFTLQPELICCINWADSGPGVCWPESYHITPIPWQQKYIVTSSRDGKSTDYPDHCLGWGTFKEEKLSVAKRLLLAQWQRLYEDGQARWASLNSEGLVEQFAADFWSGSIWGPFTEEELDARYGFD